MAENRKQNLQSSETIGKIFGISERRVQQLAGEGILPVVQTRPYKFDLLPTVQTYIKYLSNLAYNKEKKVGDNKVAESEKLRAEADLKKSKAEIVNIQLRELQGKMHRSEDVEAMTNDLVYAVRGLILALPGRLAMDVVQAATPNEASALIRAECYKILNELSAYRYDPEEYRKKVREREGWTDALAPDEANDE